MDNGDGRLTVMSSFAALVAAEEAGGRELPIPALLIFVLALLFFAFLLAVTWSFRGTHNKYARPSYGDGSSSGSQAGHTEDARADDSAHWPEHPGQH